METLAETLKRAWEWHQRGQYAQAETLYRQILSLQPTHSLTLFLLGWLELELGRYEAAAENLAAAVQGDATQAIYHATLARAHQALQRHPEAVACYRTALKLEPGDAEYHANLGTALLFCKEATEAIACYEKAIECDPEMAEAYSSLGAVLEHQGRFDEAVAHYRKAISLMPSYAQAHYNLGTAMLKRRQAVEALQSLNAAVRWQPEWVAALANLAAAYDLLGREEEARQSIEKAIERSPNDADLHCSLATVLRNQGRPEEALESYDRALTLDPENAKAAHGRALALLSLGRFAEAWPGFARRIDSKAAGEGGLEAPHWDGSPLEGKRLVVYAERGLGDTLQFIRYLPLVEARAGEVMAVVQAELIPLLGASGFGNLAPDRAAAGPCDAQVALVDLPGVFGTTLETIPADIPYLRADRRLVKRWRKGFGRVRGLKVGVAWQGSEDFHLDRFRSIPLVEFEPLGKVAGVRLISLQVGDAANQIDELAGRLEVERLDQWDVENVTFMDTAAVMTSLDLVVTSDTVTAHLAGALGVPVWVALSAAPSWRWLRDREDSPWYPTMRLFRQESANEWAPVFDRIATQLADMARQDASH
jgi:tetratricopeptide (TPR) repeat protein